MGILINVAVSSAVGVTTYLVAPAVGGAALGLLGFKAGGIAAGSAGASMMSASAAASGGGVASGGLVATLQSIGATGLGHGASAVAGTVASAAVTILQHIPK